MTELEIEDMRNELYNTALALEEMVCCQEGLLPKRVAATHKQLGYNDARKTVLNEARTQLRRVKTFMLRAGVLGNIDARVTVQPPPGVHPATVERVPEPVSRPPAQHQHIDWPKRRPRVLILGTFLAVIYGAGFLLPVIHMLLAGAFMVLVTYCGLTFEKGRIRCQ